MKPRIFPFLTVILALALLFLATGCSKDNKKAGRNWLIDNRTDLFQFQVDDLKAYTDYLNYIWENTGTTAFVSQSCYIPSGIGTLTIADGAGVQVYSRNLKDGGTFTTAVGAAGSWSIRIQLTDVEGNLNIRVQKKP
jgi:hypothetical protein